MEAVTPEVSREAIIKKYELPERQTKINTLLKMQTQAPVYCSCRSTDINNRFMIMCEKCGEWFHGDCIGMKEKDSKFIKTWFCFKCIKDYGLKIEYKSSNSSLKKKKMKKLKTSLNKNVDQNSEKIQCGQCSNCLQNEECGNKYFKFPVKNFNSYCKKSPIDVRSSSINLKSNDTHLNSKTNNMKSNDTHLGDIVNVNVNKRFKRVREPFREIAARCFGPGCYKRARLDSKYCGDQCGLALAKLRLETIIPHHIKENQKTPCMADELDRAKLHDIREEQKIIAEKLQTIELKETELRRLIETVKKLPIIKNNDNKTVKNYAKIDCPLCGWETPLKSAKKHLELCFKKLEGQFKVFGRYETNNVSSKIFCDSYDAKNKTYCKYLRSICPVHVKSGKVSENEVCGCPIVKTISCHMFPNTNSFCQQSKKKCDLHYNWENIAFAEIDFEHLQEINKMNQLVGEEGIILQRLTNRLGVLGILLNTTVPH